MPQLNRSENEVFWDVRFDLRRSESQLSKLWLAWPIQIAITPILGLSVTGSVPAAFPTPNLLTFLIQLSRFTLAYL
jgi:hypothetical protein